VAPVDRRAGDLRHVVELDLGIGELQEALQVVGVEALEAEADDLGELGYGCRYSLLRWRRTSGPA
jgi:hypothetical protein